MIIAGRKLFGLPTADLLSSVGFSRLITMDLHADQIQGFFSQPVDHLTVLPMMVSYFSKKKLHIKKC